MTPAMDCIALDPGPTRSAWVEIRSGVPRRCGLDDNATVRRVIEDLQYSAIDGFAIERFASYGCPIGEESIETILWSGRFIETALRCNIRESNIIRIRRLDIKLHICHTTKANDGTVRQALIDRFGGKETAIGRIANPGPLYYVKADIWAALAVGMTWFDIHSFNAHAKKSKP